MRGAIARTFSADTAATLRGTEDTVPACALDPSISAIRPAARSICPLDPTVLTARSIRPFRPVAHVPLTGRLRESVFRRFA